jgi:hypothetical protein
MAQLTHRKAESLLDQNWKKIKPIDWAVFHAASSLSIATTTTTGFTVIYGIDMSIENPSLTRIRWADRTILIVAYRNRVSEHNPLPKSWSWQNGWTVSYELRERPDVRKDLSIHRFNRYQAWIQDLMTYVSLPVSASDIVAIEHYAFNAASTLATTLLYELGATLRMSLVQAGLSVVEFPPTTVKKLFCGNGRADKGDMYRMFESIGMPDPFGAIGLKASNMYSHVPHPVEDMVDSFAVAMSIWWTRLDPVTIGIQTVRKKKRILSDQSITRKKKVKQQSVLVDQKSNDHTGST